LYQVFPDIKYSDFIRCARGMPRLFLLKKTTMKTRIFGIDIDFQKKTGKNFPADVIGLHARLLDACNSYQELVVLRVKQHIYVLAAGQSLEPLSEILLPYAYSNSIVDVTTSSKEAGVWLMEIANGNRWLDVDAYRLQNAIADASLLAKEMGCIGNELLPLMTQAWKESAPEERIYENPDNKTSLKRMFNYITLGDFDFPYISCN
jgi:hypothetical protein